VGENLRVRPTNRLAVRATPVDHPEPPLVRNAALTAAENLAYPPRKGSQAAVPAKIAPTVIGPREIVPHVHLAINPLGETAHRNPTATVRKEIVLLAHLVINPLGETAPRSPTATARKKTLAPAKTALRETVLLAHLAINPLGETAPRSPTATARREIVPHVHLVINPLGETARKKPYGDRPQGDRPARSFGDKPAWGDRPQKSYGDRPQGDRPTRSFGDKPAWGDKTPKSFGTGPNRGIRGDKDYWEKKQQQRGKPRYKTAEEFAPSTDDMRLNRFLAHAGICSRRDADALIADGMVTVNGKIITEMGFKVGPGDDVRYAGERLKSERKVYVLLNKPKGFITTVDDEKARKTVMDLVANACKERIYPVGRLDRGTTGVLLLTNDGAMAKKLTHPSHGAKKIYQVTLDKPLTPGDMIALKEGLVLDDGPVMVDKAEFITPDDYYNLGVELHVGRNRIVRRIFEHMGYEVVKLDRTSFAGLTKKSLERGHYRLLNSKEISFLQML
jgi:23S rRNA pseudouridine2605 synthase